MKFALKTNFSQNVIMTNKKIIINYHLRNMNYIFGNMLDSMDYDNEIQRWYRKNEECNEGKNIKNKKRFSLDKAKSVLSENLNN